MEKIRHKMEDRESGMLQAEEERGRRNDDGLLGKANINV